MHNLNIGKQMLDKSQNNDTYVSPLASRYSSYAMKALFSDNHKYKTWRKIWILLAESQQALGLPITNEQIKQLKLFSEDIDIASADRYETIFQHDVMAHIHAYGDQAPLAKPIIHLGATSCLITDNADLLIVQQALYMLKTKLIVLIKQLAKLAKKYQYTGCLSYTHFQAAQPTTFGKRTTLWLQDFLIDLEDLVYRLNTLKLLGIKGATGTQASFLDLFDQDHSKVQALEQIMLKKLGFKAYSVTGQTYTRKQDIHLLDLLSGIAASAHKFATDFRLLTHLGVINEPSKPNQVGSSAMPYKRNPILSERICSLSRFIISLSENPKYTLSVQWLERSLDDSANRRLTISEAFLSTDAVLDLLINITDNPLIYTKKIEQQLTSELPFLLTEKILMESVKKGRDRQVVHEAIRKHSLKITQEIKSGKSHSNLLFEYLGDDNDIPFSNNELIDLSNTANLVGCAPQQVEIFLKEANSKLIEFQSSDKRVATKKEKQEDELCQK